MESKKVDAQCEHVWVRENGEERCFLCGQEKAHATLGCCAHALIQMELECQRRGREEARFFGLVEAVGACIE